MTFYLAVALLFLAVLVQYVLTECESSLIFLSYVFGRLDEEECICELSPTYDVIRSN